MAAITGEWEKALKPEFSKPYYKELFTRVKQAYSEQVVYPPADEIFTAFHLTPLDKVKVVILGQDPYHEPGQAHGLAFSVKGDTKIPPSLVNIYQELHDDLGFQIPSHGCLTEWASQGVLLLNTVLTVQAHRAFSHAAYGWKEFTDAAIRAVDSQDRPIVFILWGRPAQEKKLLIHGRERYIIESPHPSPLSAYKGFFGSRPFSKANEYLISKGIRPVNWEITEKGLTE